MAGIVKALGVVACCMAGSCFAQQTPIEISTAYPVATQKYQTLTLSGSVTSANDALLAPLESGVVAELKVEVGDRVTKGQALLTLDDKLAKLSLQQARAELEIGHVALSEANRLLKEVDTLSQRQLAAKTLFQQRKAAVANASAELARLKTVVALREEMIARRTLVAPFDGEIYQRNVDVGEWIEPTDAVLALVSEQPKRLSVEVPQEYYTYFAKLDHPITITPDNSHYASVSGHLSRLVSASGNAGRSFTAHITLPADAGLLVGMSAEAELMLPDVENKQVWLPVTAIKQHPDGGASVFAVKNNKVNRVLVNIVRQQGNAVLLTNASQNQQYAVTGVSQLFDDATVSVIKGPDSND